jgi:hypothetical protein
MFSGDSQINSTFFAADFYKVTETRVVRQPSVKQEAFLDINSEAYYAFPEEMKPSVSLKEV